MWRWGETRYDTVRKILQNVLLKSKTELQERCTISEGSRLSLGRKKSSLEHLSQYVIPEEVDFLHNLRIKPGLCHKKKEAVYKWQYQQLHKFRINMTTITDVCVKIIAHRLLQIRKYLTVRWNLHWGNPHKSSAEMFL